MYDFNEEEFVNSLNEMGFRGMQKRLWIKQFRRDPKKACQSYFTKLDNMYSGQHFWEVAKQVIISSRKLEEDNVPDSWEDIEEIEPIIKDWDYFYRINNYSWGDTMYDWEEFNLAI
tara:strand:+ start:182 stop:529 length:348 start_codon:yes stop_codon:yes gene_type:complete